MVNLVGDITWPADKVERKSVKSLIPYARNARTHSDEQIAQIAASIKEWGWTNPILIDAEGGIIAGHGRVLAARKLNISDVPVMVATGWSDAQKRAYVLADNQLAMNAGWDTELLKVEVAELDADGFNLDLIGFDEKTLSGLLNDPNEGLTDPDETPEPPEEPVSVIGDVWVLGKHRLVCGDCTDALVVEKALNGVAPHLMVTDPPYGVDYDPNWRNVRARNSEGMGNRALGAGAVGEVLNDDKADWTEAWKLFPGDVAYVWCASLFADVVIQSLENAGLIRRSLVIWDKTRLIISRCHYHWQHEPCWYAVRKNKPAHWNGDRKQTTVWAIPHQKSETGHGTQKPVECMKRPIENNSSPGQAVYEPFSGSGTTIIAAEMIGRACHAIELNPAYVDVAIQRWQDFTGEKAKLEADGRTFDDIKAERHE